MKLETSKNSHPCPADRIKERLVECTVQAPARPGTVLRNLEYHLDLLGFGIFFDAASGCATIRALFLFKRLPMLGLCAVELLLEDRIRLDRLELGLEVA